MINTQCDWTIIKWRYNNKTLNLCSNRPKYDKRNQALLNYSSQPKINKSSDTSSKFMYFCRPLACQSQTYSVNEPLNCNGFKNKTKIGKYEWMGKSQLLPLVFKLFNFGI